MDGFTEKLRKRQVNPFYLKKNIYKLITYKNLVYNIYESCLRIRSSTFHFVSNMDGIIILIIVSVFFTAIAIMYAAINRKSMGTQLNILFIILVFIFIGIFLIVASNLLRQTYFNKDVALTLWKLSIIIRLLSLILFLSIHSFILEYKKIKIISSFLFSILAGIIASLLFFIDSVQIVETRNEYIYSIQDIHLMLFLIIFDILIVCIMWYVQLSNYPKFRDKKLGHLLSAILINISVIIILNTIYIITQDILFRIIYLICYMITVAFVIYALIKKPNAFVVLTNKIYDFIIFHRSGILLYTYNFETGKESDDSILKGSILIGINHILSNFIDMKDKLNLIKMKDRDIIFEYDNNFGFALLLITNHRNTIIEKSVRKFMEKFSERYDEILKSIKNSNKIIDVSEFKNSKELINTFFNPYIVRN